MELEELVEGSSYTVRYGVDDAEHEFDNCIFDGFWSSDINDDTRPAFLQRTATPYRLLFDPDKICRITPE